MSFDSYDNWKTEEKSSLAENYANAVLDNMSTEDVVKKAVELKLCHGGGIYRLIETAVFEHFVNQYYQDRDE